MSFIIAQGSMVNIMIIRYAINKRASLQDSAIPAIFGASLIFKRRYFNLSGHQIEAYNQANPRKKIVVLIVIVLAKIITLFYKPYKAAKPSFLRSDIMAVITEAAKPPQAIQMPTS